MTSSVDRTFVINFRVVPNKLKYPEIFAFITNKLGLAVTDLKHLQITNSRVFVGTDSPQTAQNVVQEHNMQHQLESNGKSYTIPISMEDGSVEVRVHDLRPRITNRQLAMRMREYGEIFSIRDEVWKDYCPGVPNGVRIVRMKLSKPIPSYVTVETEMTLVTYKGQVATCKHCNRNVHYTQKCSDYAKSLQTSVNDRLTMADVVRGSGGDRVFLQPRRRERSLSTKNQHDSGKNLPQHRSNVSLAGSEISISSTEPAESMSVEPSSVITPASQGASGISPAANIDRATTENQESSPPFHGFDEATIGNNINNAQRNDEKQQSNANVKRAGSPLYADSNNADKKPSHSPRRSRSITKLSKH